MDQVIGGSLLDRFSALDDPRQVAKVLYPLPEIILLLLCATLAGADDFVEMTLWGERHLAFLRRLRPFVHGIPSHDTLGEVIRAVDPDLFKRCFASWVEGLRAGDPDIIAIDGKTSRRTHARNGTVKLAAGGGGRGRVAKRDDNTCLAQLRRPPVSGRDHQPRGLAVFPLPAQPAHGRGDAGCTRHHREPRERAAMGPEVRPGVRPPDPAEAALRRR